MAQILSSILGSIGGVGGYFEKEIAQVTSTENNVNGQINYAGFLDVADCLKSGKWNAKAFCVAIVKRIEGERSNGNIILNVLGLLDTCVKNAGAGFLSCFSSKEIVDQLLELSRDQNQQVRQKAREYIQTWALLVKGNQDMFLIVELYENLKRLGIEFPAVVIPISSALVETTLAPPWTDSEACNRCRASFTTFNRKHHCRNCGNVFCQECSGKSIPLPALGITDPVRVCDPCHFKITNKQAGSNRNLSVHTTVQSNSKETPVDEEEDALQKAIAASLEISTSRTGTMYDVKKQHVAFSPDVTSPGDEDLENAIKASLREAERFEKERDGQRKREEQDRERERQKEREEQDRERRNEQKTEAYRSPTTFEPYQPHMPEIVNDAPQRPSSDLSPTQLENISLFATLVESTAHEISQKGYAQFNPLPLQTLFAQVSTLHPQLTASLQEAADKYKELYDMNNAVHDVIGSYDTYLQQRLLYSQGARGFGGAAPMFGQPTGSPLFGSVTGAPAQHTFPSGLQNSPQHGQFSQSSPPIQNPSPSYNQVPLSTSQISQQPPQPLSYQNTGSSAVPSLFNSAPPFGQPGQPVQLQSQHMYSSQNSYGGQPYQYSQTHPSQPQNAMKSPPQGVSNQSQPTSFSGGYLPQQSPHPISYQGLTTPSQPPGPGYHQPQQPLYQAQNPTQAVQPQTLQAVQPQTLQQGGQGQQVHVPEAPQDAPLIEL